MYSHHLVTEELLKLARLVLHWKDLQKLRRDNATQRRPAPIRPGLIPVYPAFCSPSAKTSHPQLTRCQRTSLQGKKKGLPKNVPV